MSAARPAVLLAVVALNGSLGCSRCQDEPAKAVAGPTRPSTPQSRPAPPPGIAGREAPRLAPVPETPLTDEDIAACDTADNLHKRIGCLGSLAQRNRDPRFCDKIAELSKQSTAQDPDIIRSGTSVHACLRTIAFMRDDPSLCARIGQPSMAGSCLSYFAMKRQDPTVCDLARGGEATHTCYLNEAARTRDSSLCEKTGPFQDDCAKRLGPIDQ